MKRPKCHLSAFNLFYRFKREQILEAHRNVEDNESKAIIHELINTMSGVEECPRSTLSALSPEQVKAFRRTKIRSALQQNLYANASKRCHRKSHGAMCFVEMK